MTEVVFKLGAQERLVGRTEYCLYPEAAKEIPSVGAYLNPDYEKIVSLRPDLIILFPNQDLEIKFKELGLRTFAISNETVKDVLATIREIGKAIDLETRANKVIKGITDTLEMVKKAGTPGERISAFLAVGREKGSLKGLYAAGRETYLSEIWSYCGGGNVFDDIEQRYFGVSKEDLIKRDPQFIMEFRIITSPNKQEEIKNLKSDWAELPVLQAYQKNQIEVFPDRLFLIPGPRISEIAIAFSNLISRTSH
jgi:iron complex transport system substrate-binding protein